MTKQGATTQRPRLCIAASGFSNSVITNCQVAIVTTLKSNNELLYVASNKVDLQCFDCNVFFFFFFFFRRMTDDDYDNLNIHE